MQINFRRISAISSSCAIALIRLYQRCISPALGPRCRFFPSCSEYALECIEAHGVLNGSLLGAKRLCKCHPWHPGGMDLPPSVPLKNVTNHNS